MTFQNELTIAAMKLQDILNEDLIEAMLSPEERKHLETALDVVKGMLEIECGGM